MLIERSGRFPTWMTQALPLSLPSPTLLQASVRSPVCQCVTDAHNYRNGVVFILVKRLSLVCAVSAHRRVWNGTPLNCLVFFFPPFFPSKERSG